jgi:hypothetical protein
MAIETTKENINILNPLNSSLSIDFNSDDIISQYLSFNTSIYFDL